MIELKDFIVKCQTELNNQILDVTAGEIQEMTIQFGIEIYDKEKCKEWIKQAMEIENYTAEQVESLKVRHLLEKKDVEIKYLKQQNCELKEKIEELEEGKE